MSKPLIIKIGFMVCTPAFLGDAEQRAALRPQSFKGLLRFWHRVIDSNILKKDASNRCVGTDLEDRIWGGRKKGYGQSQVLLRIESQKQPDIWTWRKNEFSRYSSGSGREVINGAWYLGYPFSLKGNERRNALDHGTMFTLKGVIPAADKTKEEEIKGILAAFWLLSMLGSCGTRCRRGFGSLQATSWELQNAEERKFKQWRELFEQLPRPDLPNSVRDWNQTMQAGLACFSNWYDPFPQSLAHAHITSGFSPLLLSPCRDWQEALARAGEKMQRFRRRQQPDYNNIKTFLSRLQPGITAPERCSFGLPLTFRFSRGNNRGPVTCYPQRPGQMANLPERSASLLGIKVIRLGVNFYPLFYLLNGMVPSAYPGIRAVSGRGRQSQSFNMVSPKQSAMHLFFDGLKKEAAV